MQTSNDKGPEMKYHFHRKKKIKGNGLTTASDYRHVCSCHFKNRISQEFGLKAINYDGYNWAEGAETY